MVEKNVCVYNPLKRNKHVLKDIINNLKKKSLDKKCKHGKHLSKDCIQCKSSDKKCKHGKLLDKKCLICKPISKNLLLVYKYSIKKDKNIRFNILLKAIKKETYTNVLKNLKDLKKNNLKNAKIDAKINAKIDAKIDAKKYDYDINRLKKWKKENSTHILHGGNKQKIDIIDKLINEILNIEKELKNNYK